MSFEFTATSHRHPRVLIVRLGAMGDLIQTLPVASDLRRRFPDARIDWAVDSLWQPLLAGNPSLDAAVPVDLRRWRRSPFVSRNWFEASGLVRTLRSAGYDIAIDVQGLLKSATIARLSGAGMILGLERGLLREPLAELLYDRRVSSQAAHVVDRYRELASLGQGREQLGAARFHLPLGQPPAGLPDRFVLASPQAGWGTKQWPFDHYGLLAAILWKEHGLPLVAACPPAQGIQMEQIVRAAPPGAVLPYPSTIPQLVGVTRAATLVVGVDSGPLHLAAALEKGGVALFGPTDPARNGPYGQGFTVLRETSARTTYKRGADPSDSMRSCSPEAVYQALRPMLG